MDFLNAWAVDPVFRHNLAAPLSVLLILGASQKLRDLPLFAAVVENYQILPAALSWPAAVLVAVAELLAGIGLPFLPWRAPAAALASLLLLLVTAAVAVNLWRGRDDIDCGCGGISRQPGLSWALVGRNGLLLLLLALTATGSPSRPLLWIDYFSVSAGTLALLALYSAGNLMLANTPQTLSLRNR
ncbi:MAG TPA: MauE/DoxX family redox-associated membrane protein [Azospira sp.]|nr:MauE/DoxX family redox-associated membrane protein [Azospira sp.]